MTITVLSRCKVRRSETYVTDYMEADGRCSGRLTDKGITGGCGDPCSFIMQKRGSGEPDFIDVETALEQILNVLRTHGIQWRLRRKIDEILHMIHRGGYRW